MVGSSGPVSVAPDHAAAELGSSQLGFSSSSAEQFPVSAAGYGGERGKGKKTHSPKEVPPEEPFQGNRLTPSLIRF